MTTPPNGYARRQLDEILIRQLQRIEDKLDNFENRVTKLETYATVRGMVGGAITTALTAIAGAIIWLLKG